MRGLSGARYVVPWLCIGCHVKGWMMLLVGSMLPGPLRTHRRCARTHRRRHALLRPQDLRARRRGERDQLNVHRDNTNPRQHTGPRWHARLHCKWSFSCAVSPTAPPVCRAERCSASRAAVAGARPTRRSAPNSAVYAPCHALPRSVWRAPVPTRALTRHHAGDSAECNAGVFDRNSKPRRPCRHGRIRRPIWGGGCGRGRRG